MRLILVILLGILFSNGYTQYYFNDIIATGLSNEQYKLLRAAKTHKIKAISFDADNSKSESFFLEEEISLDGKKISLNASIAGGKSSITNSTYELGMLKIIDQIRNGIEGKTVYTYTDKGQIKQLLFTTIDTALQDQSAEIHEWTYAESGEPKKMLRIKNNTDTLVVEFAKDENGLITEENWKKKNRTVETYYYYYDANNHLTDIVRYQTKLKKLIPDFQYEFDTAGRIKQMIQISLSSASYLIWKYNYNEKGLKINETGFDKEKKIVGRIEYIYE